MPTPRCMICSGATNPLFVKDGFPHLICSSCKLVFVYPQPEPAFLKEEVYSAKSGYQGNRVVDLSKTRPEKKRRAVLAHLAFRSKKSPAVGKRLLDIGCSNGELMYHAQKLGYEVAGVELNAKTADNARAHGLNVFTGFLKDAGYAPGSFDVIHMGDLIEHVNDPRALLDEARALLSSAGELIIVTPNMECFWGRTTFALWRLFRIPWSLSTPPHHLWQFSASNLELLLRQSGYAVTKRWYGRSPSLRYELGSLHLLKRWKARRTIGALGFMVVAYGLYTILHIINRVVELLPLKRFDLAYVAAPSHR